jgi:hypothetical protein
MTIGSSRRRWLAVLLAFLIGAAMLFASAGRADADGFSLPSLTATPNGCSVDITVESGSFYIFIYRVDVFQQWHLVDRTDFDPTWIEPGGSEHYTIDDLTPGTYVAVAEPLVFLLDPFTISPDDCHPTFSGDGFTGQIFCTGDCSVVVNPPGDGVADLTINTSAFFKLVLTTTDKDHTNPPGKSFVVDDKNNNGAFDNDDIQLAKCGSKGSNSGENCVHINAVKGGFTQYTVFYDHDPRLKFG